LNNSANPVKLNSLDFFFSPRSVAIIGASPGKTGFACPSSNGLRQMG
jgi:hypothetical protein